MREAVEGLLKIREEIPEPIKTHDTQKEEKSGTFPPVGFQPERLITKEEIPQKETYQDKPLFSESSIQKKGKIYGVVLAVVLVLLGGYFFLNQEKQPKQDLQLEQAKQLEQTRNSIGMEFALIPSGSFMMGCSECGDAEKPKHKVSITNSFFIGKYEVTQGQWKQVMGSNPSNFQNCGDNCPVESVSWNDTQEFIKKLCEAEKMNPCKYRLPTEAEWEYAARAGSKTSIYMGEMKILGNNSPELDGIAWYGGNSGVSYGGGIDCSGWSEKQYSSSKCGTQMVGQKKPNAWGLYDMIGNVWEWNEDLYDSEYYKNSPNNDPKGLNSGEYRVLRGGSWSRNARGSRLSLRGYHNLGRKGDDCGFRLVLLP
jgi:formylglycine-generating enzyme required for sulfatase activity